ncbi:MAG: glycyl-tRNA synthetase, glycyl-tRNA synthetase [Candidatus Peregrinibacteria bacterium GW2011_GWC2_39_14]|nr:MAG: glycyl-tRNA synthetase, glycyl-tRNA synthetase [Candidatus Peregrinibacteria bacterium GW2011_GWC2_39_14]
MDKKDDSMEKVVALCKRRGFVFQGSEIYGGLANTWDFGPYGVELKNNIKRSWWKHFIQEREDMVGLDSSILMHPRVWEATGHVASFTDPLIDCKKCHERFRGDKLIEEKEKDDFYTVKNRYLYGLKSRILFSERYMDLYESIDENKRNKAIDEIKKKNSTKSNNNLLESSTLLQGKSLLDEMEEISQNDLKFVNYFIKEKKIACPTCKSTDFTEAREFNMMFKTNQGVIENETSMVYLRPETAQGIFVNFRNISAIMRKKLPFGVGQIGKAFRNEITPGNFIFRTREFEQMEIEYFIREKGWEKSFKEWEDLCKEWFEKLGIDKKNMRYREHDPKELAFYSKKTVDIEYKFPFGWGELMGIAYRTDYDLKRHIEFSGQDLTYFDQETNERFVPHVIEPSFGMDRTVLTVLVNAYAEDSLGGEARIFMKFDPKIAPVKAAIFPLIKKEGLPEIGRKIWNDLKSEFTVEYDESGSIGKRYRRQDEIGTPFCITVDFDTLKDNTVTIRERDSGEQKRVKIEELRAILAEKVR